MTDAMLWYPYIIMVIDDDRDWWVGAHCEMDIICHLVILSLHGRRALIWSRNRD